MRYEIHAKNHHAAPVYPLGEDFRGVSRNGDTISFNNYYMEKNGRPFYAVSGEFHFSRMDSGRWEDELIKMRMGGKSTRGWRSNLKLNQEIVRGNRENGYFCCLPMLMPKYAFKIFEFILPRLGLERGGGGKERR